MKLCFEIYYFDEDAFGFDVSFPEDENFIVLDENVSGNDIALLIGSLLSLNELHLNNEFIEALHKEDELALVGGLIFQKEDIIIGPSCCADLQGWREIVEGVRSEKTSWMGHDPAPWFEFSGDDIILWSDEAGSEKLFSIRYCKSEFESLSFVSDQ
jgi:hypothetical protein